MTHEITVQKQEGNVLIPTSAETNSPFHAQNTVEWDGCTKHRQHVNLINDHMQVVPASQAEKGKQHQGSLSHLNSLSFIVNSGYRSDSPTAPAAHPPKIMKAEGLVHQKGPYTWLGRTWKAQSPKDTHEKILLKLSILKQRPLCGVKWVKTYMHIVFILPLAL